MIMRGCSVIARLPWYCPAAAVPTWHYLALGLGVIVHIPPTCYGKNAGRLQKSNVRAADS